MNEIIQSLETNATNGKENFCYISEDKLKVLKELSKREYEENKKYKEVIDKAIMYVNSTRYSDINGLQKYSIKEFWFIKELEDILKEVKDK